MATILLAETDPKLKRVVHGVENICHEAGLGVIIHHEGEDLDDLLDMAECTLLVLTPNGKLTPREAVKKYGYNVLLAVGGFEEERDFKSSIYARAEGTVSLGKGFLTIPEVIEKIIDAYAPEKG